MVTIVISTYMSHTTAYISTFNVVLVSCSACRYLNLILKQYSRKMSIAFAKNIKFATAETMSVIIAAL